MNLNNHNKNNLFLMEIIIDIFFFSILLVISLELFVKAHNLSEDATSLHRAVIATENAVSHFQNVESNEELAIDYPDAAVSKDVVILYLGEDYLPCHEADSTYEIQIMPSEEAPGIAWEFRFCEGDDIIYEVTASRYQQKEVAYE